VRVLDTDTCVAILRGNKKVQSRRAAIVDDVATTWVTASELFFGAARSRHSGENAALVTRFLSTLDVLSPDLSSARLFGEMKATLFDSGQPIADADLVIASIAVARGASVVTGNRKHFDRIPGMMVEDWLRGS
jgi:tRNA(fMet)-specific endonuclease VapC